MGDNAAVAFAGKGLHTVVDVTGARVAGALILIASRSTTRELQSDKIGGFHATLAAGVYRIKVVGNGFRTANLKTLRIQSGISRTLKVVLTMGPPNNGGRCPKGYLCL